MEIRPTAFKSKSPKVVSSEIIDFLFHLIIWLTHVNWAHIVTLQKANPSQKPSRADVVTKNWS